MNDMVRAVQQALGVDVDGNAGPGNVARNLRSNLPKRAASLRGDGYEGG